MKDKKEIKEVKKGRGRPRKEIDFMMVKELAEHACTIEEIASYLGCSHDILARNTEFKRVYQEGLHKCRRSLRRVQYEAAMDGDRTMLVWLGKCLLGQKETKEVDMTLQGGQEPVKVKTIKERIKELEPYNNIFKETST